MMPAGIPLLTMPSPKNEDTTELTLLTDLVNTFAMKSVTSRTLSNEISQLLAVVEDYDAMARWSEATWMDAALAIKYALSSCVREDLKLALSVPRKIILQSTRNKVDAESVPSLYTCFAAWKQFGIFQKMIDLLPFTPHPSYIMDIFISVSLLSSVESWFDWIFSSMDHALGNKNAQIRLVSIRVFASFLSRFANEKDPTFTLYDRNESAEYEIPISMLLRDICYSALDSDPQVALWSVEAVDCACRLLPNRFADKFEELWDGGLKDKVAGFLESLSSQHMHAATLGLQQDQDVETLQILMTPGLYLLPNVNSASFLNYSNCTESQGKKLKDLITLSPETLSDVHPDSTILLETYLQKASRIKEFLGRKLNLYSATDPSKENSRPHVETKTDVATTQSCQTSLVTKPIDLPKCHMDPRENYFSPKSDCHSSSTQSIENDLLVSAFNDIAHLDAHVDSGMRNEWTVSSREVQQPPIHHRSPSPTNSNYSKNNSRVSRIGNFRSPLQRSNEAQERSPSQYVSQNRAINHTILLSNSSKRSQSPTFSTQNNQRNSRSPSPGANSFTRNRSPPKTHSPISDRLRSPKILYTNETTTRLSPKENYEPFILPPPKNNPERVISRSPLFNNKCKDSSRSNSSNKINSPKLSFQLESSTTDGSSGADYCIEPLLAPLSPSLVKTLPIIIQSLSSIPVCTLDEFLNSAAICCPAEVEGINRRTDSWKLQLCAIGVLRCALLEYQINLPLLPIAQLAEALSVAAENLRSHVAKAALLAFRELCDVAGRSVDLGVPKSFPRILKRASDKSSTFIAGPAEMALYSLINNAGENRLVKACLTALPTIKSSQVTQMMCESLNWLIFRIQISGNMLKHRDFVKLIEFVVTATSNASPDTRAAARQALAVLDDDCMNAFARQLSPSAAKKIQSLNFIKNSSLECTEL